MMSSLFNSLVGSFWRHMICQVPDKTRSCLLFLLAGRRGKIIWEGSTMLIMKPEPHNGSGPPRSKMAPISKKINLKNLMNFISENLNVCLPLNRDGNLEVQRRQNSNTDAAHVFITRRQISEHEDSTQESPEVTL